MKKFLIFISFLLVLVGCGDDEVSSLEINAEEENLSTEEDVDSLYDNPYFEVSKIEGWAVDKKKSSEEGAVFVNNSSVAIVSKLDEDKKEDWKNQVLESFSNNAEITEETDHYLAVETKRKENIHGDVYKLEGANHDVLVIIMTPEKSYEKQKDVIQEFKQYIILK